MRSTLFVIGLAALTILPARAEDTAAVKKDLAALQGEWSMVSGSADGMVLPDEMREQAKRVCKGDELTVTIGPQLLMKAKITIDPSKTPKTINYEVIDGPAKGKKHLGIYELEGDTMKSCFAAPDEPRPKEFAGKAGEKRTVSVWKRDKKQSSAP
jgi:uncharacterized protein (TIGR03067 family)